MAVPGFRSIEVLKFTKISSPKGSIRDFNETYSDPELESEYYVTRKSLEGTYFPCNYYLFPWPYPGRIMKIYSLLLEQCQPKSHRH